jgi:hypothetical protein
MPRNKRDYSYTDVEDPSIINEEIFMPSTLETVDFAVYNWVNDDLNIFATTNKGWKKIPIVWSSPERARFREDKEARDSTGALILPVISIERGNISKELTKRTKVYAPIQRMRDVQGGELVISRVINQEKTSNFAEADAFRTKRKNVDVLDRNRPRNNKKVVYQTKSIPIPTYIEIDYSVTVQTEYQQQMNEILSSFVAHELPGPDNYFMVNHDGHRYEAFVDASYEMDNNASNLEEEERKYQTKINMKVIGYILSPDKNGNRPRISTRENAVEFKIARERVVLDEKPTQIGKDGFYKG